MATITRTDLLGAHPAEVARHLAGKGVGAIVRDNGANYEIEAEGVSAAAITTALLDFVATLPKADWRDPLPADLPAHVAHLVQFFTATPAQLAALTQPQRDHVTQDIIRVMKRLMDDRLA